MAPRGPPTRPRSASPRWRRGRGRGCPAWPPLIAGHGPGSAPAAPIGPPQGSPCPRGWAGHRRGPPGAAPRGGAPPAREAPELPRVAVSAAHGLLRAIPPRGVESRRWLLAAVGRSHPHINPAFLSIKYPQLFLAPSAPCFYTVSSSSLFSVFLQIIVACEAFLSHLCAYKSSLNTVVGATGLGRQRQNYLK